MSPAFPTRRGSRLTDADARADDAPSVVGLKAAGAVIVGKTTTTEFGWKSPGDCPLHGITRNPWNPRLHHRRLVIRGRRGGRGGVRPAAYRHRRRRLDPHSGGMVRPGRAEADLRPHPAMAGERVPRRVLRRADDAHGARRRADVLRHGALRPARSVLRARRWPRLARRHRGWRRRPDRRRAAPAWLRRAGGRGARRRRRARGVAAGRCRRRRGGCRSAAARHARAVLARLGRRRWGGWWRSTPEDKRGPAGSRHSGSGRARWAA